jgi:hypothetical protein
VGNGLEDDERHLMVTVARLIWFRRNKFIFEGVFQDPKTMVRIAREQVTAVDNAIRRNTEPTLRNNTARCCSMAETSTRKGEDQLGRGCG